MSGKRFHPVVDLGAVAKIAVPTVEMAMFFILTSDIVRLFLRLWVYASFPSTSVRSYVPYRPLSEPGSGNESIIIP